MDTKQEEPGFTYRLAKSGDVQVRHRGRLAITLRGRGALDFLRKVESAGPLERQQLMARLTGNYKRGNERVARQHPRNQR